MNKIPWNYLDKRRGTARALADYENMKFIIESEQKVSAADGADFARGGFDVLAQRRRQAREYMDWFAPAWEKLSDDERYTLLAFYGAGNSYGRNAAFDVAERYNMETTSAYKKKNRALEKLAVLLYGEA